MMQHVSLIFFYQTRYLYVFEKKIKKRMPEAHGAFCCYLSTFCSVFYCCRGSFRPATRAQNIDRRRGGETRGAYRS